MTGWTLRGTRLSAQIGATAVAAVLIQFALGAEPSVVMMACAIVFAGLVGFAWRGAYCSGSWVILLYMLGNVLVALYAKTLFGQAIDSHLYTPAESYAVITASTAALFVALIVVSGIRLGRPLLKRTDDPELLAWVSWGSLLIGVTASLLGLYLVTKGGAGIGGFGVLRDLVIMAVVARTALVLERTGDKKSIDMTLIMFLAITTSLGLIANSKTQTVYPVISYFATSMFYRRRLTTPQVGVLLAGAVTFLLVFVPMIQAWRLMGQQRLPIAERIELMSAGVAAIVGQQGEFSRYQRLGHRQFRHGYYNYFGGEGRGQEVLGRFSSVQQVDPVIAEVDRQGELGGKAIWPAFIRLLPRAIYPNKPKYNEAYHSLVDLGLINPHGGKYPTLPIAAQAYAGYGWAGVLWCTLIIFTAFLLVLKKLGWNLYRNIYAIFFLLEFGIVYVAQGSVGQYGAFIFRNAITFAAVFWGIKLALQVTKSLGREVHGVDRLGREVL